MKGAYWGNSQPLSNLPARSTRGLAVPRAPGSVLFGCSIDEIAAGPSIDPTLLLELGQLGERRVIVDTGFCANALFADRPAPGDATIFMARHDLEVEPFSRWMTFSEVALPKALLDRARERQIDGVLNPQLIDPTVFTIVDFSLGQILGFSRLKPVREYIGIGWRSHLDRDDRHYGALSTVLTLDERVTGLVSVDSGSSHTRFFLPPTGDRSNACQETIAPRLEHIIRIGTNRKVVRTMNPGPVAPPGFEEKYIGALGYDLGRDAAVILMPQAEDHWELILH